MSGQANLLLLIAAGLCCVTALIHSLAGERKLIGPIISGNTPIMQHDLARQVLRFAWHWTSALWLIVALALALSAYNQTVNFALILAIGIVHVAMGLADALYTRGKHIGWPFITLIGVLTLLAIFQT